LWWGIHGPTLGLGLALCATLPPRLGGLLVLRWPLDPHLALGLGLLSLLTAVPILRHAVRHDWHLRHSVAVAHAAAFLVAALNPDPLAGGLGLAIWHTVQYQAFVYQAQRRAPTSLIAWATRRGWRYVIWLGVLGTLVYQAPVAFAGLIGVDVVTVGALVYLVGQSHHFLLDTWVWGRRVPRAHWGLRQWLAVRDHRARA
jgi:hypothetical protein